MIPKIIHYCWFGGNPLPKSALKCIESWKKFFPDYEIKEWNESNFDISQNLYIRQAYEAKKYAFVSDYARYQILYKYGGIYFDTDVEVIKPFNDILSRGSFFGCETDGNNKTGAKIKVAPGLGCAVTAGNRFYEEMLNLYSELSFYNPDSTLNTTTIVEYTTDLLLKHGLVNSPKIQCVDDIYIYPKEYFNPRNNNTGKLTKTGKTHSIHWYDMSWLSVKQRRISKVTRVFHRLFGEDCFERFKKK